MSRARLELRGAGLELDSGLTLDADGLVIEVFDLEPTVDNASGRCRHMAPRWRNLGNRVV